MPNININVLINRYWNNWQVDSNIEQFSEKLNAYKEAIKNNIDSNESEENLKNKLSDFLKSTFYKDKDVNTKVRIDLAIMNRNDNNKVEVIFEQKSPVNKAEFPKHNDLNCKATQELLLYYLREKIDNQNSGIKFLIATNGYEFYVFDAVDFRKLFYDNKKLIKEYNPWREKKVDDNTTQHFYDKIAKKYIEEVKDILPFVYFDIRNENEETLYKFFSPYTLLKRSHPNDSNTLNTEFYNELLYIMGLKEVSNKGVIKITRAASADRRLGSLLENTLEVLRPYLINSLTDLPAGKDEEVRFELALELVITWINRILFLKLLESQLIVFNREEGKKTNDNFRFLKTDVIKDYSKLNSLFFSVLAVENKARHKEISKLFKKLPYLNSALFELTKREEQLFCISSLPDIELKIYNNSILIKRGKYKVNDTISSLEYLFEFLDSYNFASHKNEVSSNTNTIINAAVLGLVFEKINGYKDGAVFTPGYITEYMCRDAIRRVIVQKFNEARPEGVDEFKTYEGVKNYCLSKNEPADIEQLKTVFDSIRICDPAVGSGHFLVSALNEMILIKKDLGLLRDVPYDIQIENDELLITDTEGAVFVYERAKNDSQTVQKALFKAKRDIIENSLFGVDINPNSVNICRLRLWIELLKHSYYEEKELQTLPNLDINIKCGNSLISNFGLDADPNRISNNDVRVISRYKSLVESYKNITDKKEKYDIEAEINDIVKGFNNRLFSAEQKKKSDALDNAKIELLRLERDNRLFPDFIDERAEEKKQRYKQIIADYSKEIDKIKVPSYLTRTLEWRFEFPEVLDKKGNFVGFDLVIGNPPYVSTKAISEDIKNVLEQKYGFADDLYSHFFFKATDIAKKDATISLITSKSFWSTLTKANLREKLLSQNIITIFDSANPFKHQEVDTCITIYKKQDVSDNNIINILDGRRDFDNPKTYEIAQSVFANAHNKLIFIPNEYNLKVYDRYNAVWVKLLDKWWDKISTSKKIVANKNDLEKHRAKLKTGDITLLGCLTEGGQGLATGDNGKYIAVRRNTDYADRIIRTRPEKLFAALNDDDKAKYKINSTADAVEFLSGKSEAEIVELFDEIKENYGRDIFGQGYLYRIIDDSEIADVSKLSKDEKENGIDKDKAYYVPYDKGDREGNRWYAPTPYAIAWTKENVQFLTEKSGKKGEGMPVVRNKDFYFKDGFCWNNVLNPNSKGIKTRIKGQTIHDVASMTLGTVKDSVPDYFLICLLNSTFIFYFLRVWINATVNIQINDARMIPIVVPTAEQLAAFKEHYDKAIAIKKGESNESLEKVENKIDSLVFDLYGISENERKYLDEYYARAENAEEIESEDEIDIDDSEDENEDIEE